MQHNTARELQELFIWYLVEPYGQEWQQTAQQCSVAAKLAGVKKHVDTEDFLPVRPPPKKGNQTARDIFRGLFLIAGKAAISQETYDSVINSIPEV